MSDSCTYQVLLLPHLEAVACELSLAEAVAWMRTYNDVMQGDPYRAVVAEEAPLRRAA